MTPAAAKPIANCRVAETSSGRAVNNEVPAPISTSATPLAARLASSAPPPLSQKSGATGNIFFNIASPFTFAVTVTLIYYVAMTVFDQLVYTRVVGRSVGLHPVVSFFVVFSGAALFGPIGMILAFPVAGSVKVILDRLFRITSKDQDGLDLPAIPLRHRAMVQA